MSKNNDGYKGFDWTRVINWDVVNNPTSEQRKVLIDVFGDKAKPNPKSK